MNLQVQFYAAGDHEPPFNGEPPCDVTHDTVSGDKQEVCFEGTLQIQTKTLIFAPILPFIALTILLTKGLARTCIFNKNKQLIKHMKAITGSEKVPTYLNYTQCFYWRQNPKAFIPI